MEAGSVLVVAAVATAAGDWLAVWRRSRAELVLKPLALALLVAAAVAFRGDWPSLRWVAVVAALALSLAGDVFLMLPRDLFVTGLGSFLLAHVAYVVAFNPSPPPLLPTLPAAVVVAGLGGFLFLRIRAGMRRTGRGALAPPVAVYVLAIGAMVVSAMATAGRPDWSPGRSALAITGACLFFLSDALIGWTRFVREVRGGSLAIIVAYHLAQVALVLALLG